MSLRCQRGVSTSEFLICAPIAALLAFVAVDLNKRIEERQVVSIMARNAAYSGNPTDSLRGISKAQLTAMGNIVDAKELAELTGTPSQPSDSGLHLNVREGSLHGESELSGRVGSSGVSLIDANGATSTLQGLSNVEGEAAKVTGQLVSGAQAVASGLGLLSRDYLRVAEVEIRSTGNENSNQRAASFLEQVVGNRGKSDPLLYPERRHGHATYARVHSGYHPNDYTLSSLWGMGVGYVTRDAWGAKSGPDLSTLEKGKFSDKADFLQARCITRLAQNNSCGGGGFFGGLVANLPQGLKERLASVEVKGEKAQEVAEARKQAEKEGESTWIQDQILEGLGEQIQGEMTAINAEIGKLGGGGDHDRGFLTKIRNIAAAKAIIDLLLKVFAGNANKAIEAPAEAMIKEVMPAAIGQMTGQIAGSMTSKLGTYAGEKVDGLVQDMLAPAETKAKELGGTAPASSLKGKLHAP